MAHRSGHRPLVGGDGRRLERRRDRPRDLHCWDPVHPGGVHRCRPARGRGLGAGSGTSSCPLSRNATFTVILLSFIGGLRTFDLIWTMTRGGPGFTTDVHRIDDLQAVSGRVLRSGDGRERDPVRRGHGACLSRSMRFFAETGDRAVRIARLIRSWSLDVAAWVIAGIVFIVPFVFIVLHRGEGPGRSRHGFEFTPPDRVAARREPRARSSDSRNDLMVTALRNSLILTVLSVDAHRPRSRRWSAFVLQRRRDRVGAVVSALVLAGFDHPARRRADHLRVAVDRSVQDPDRPHRLSRSPSFCRSLCSSSEPSSSSIPRELDEAAIIDGATPIAAVPST